MYELGTYSSGTMCSAVLVNRGDYVYHSRNLDYFFAEILAKMTVILNFKKNGVLLFKAVTQAGFTGVHTGVAFDRFTIDLNERDIGKRMSSFWAFFQGHWRVPGLIRHALTTAESYQ